MLILSADPRGTSQGLLLVRQPDHAALSGQVAAAWRRPEILPASIWPRFIDAVAHHDDGWIEAEKEPALDPRGRPYSFASMPIPAHTELWRRGVEIARERDPYAALLVAQHGRWLYTRFPRTSSPEELEAARRFLGEMDVVKIACVEALDRGTPDERSAVRPEALLSGRRLLSFFDAISLELLGAIAREGSTEELPAGATTSRLRLDWRGDSVLVSPWSFEPPEVAVHAPRWRLDRSRFSSPQDFAGVLSSAVALPFRGVLRAG